MKFVPEHKHLIVKAKVKTPPRTDAAVKHFLSEAVDKVGMTVINGPHASYVSEPGNEGATGVAILAESHTAMHVWDAVVPAEIQFDLYSCKTFDPQVIIQMFARYNPLEIHFKFLDREFDFIELDSGTEVYGDTAT